MNVDLTKSSGQIESYSVSSEIVPVSRVEKQHLEPSESKKELLMKVRCHNCGKSYETTFSAEDFERLAPDQVEAGTLHLCPYCGDLSLYTLKDHFESE